MLDQGQADGVFSKLSAFVLRGSTETARKWLGVFRVLSAGVLLFGLTVGDDFMEGKATLPFIYTLTQATAAEADFLKKALNDKNADAFKQVCELIHRYKGDDYTQSKIATHINRARLAISKLPNCAHDPYLNALFDWLSTRQS